MGGHGGRTRPAGCGPCGAWRGWTAGRRRGGANARVPGSGGIPDDRAMTTYRWVCGVVLALGVQACGDDAAETGIDGTTTMGPTAPTLTMMTSSTEPPTTGPTEGTETGTDPSGTITDSESNSEVTLTTTTLPQTASESDSMPTTSTDPTATDGTSSTGPGPSCGDGAVDDGEQCDDGNADNTDACLDTCVSASCGDGFVGPGEACDDGNTVDDDECTNACAPASCGDGAVQAGEQCDDGNADNTDTCLDTCVSASCGDGFVGPGEACDDGNAVDDDACSNACAAASCGDGAVQMGEACDDGNADNSDMCLDTCVAASCGDGFEQAGVEQCDDGNAVDTDACVGMCEDAACGDGLVQAGVEECDDGNNTNTDACVAMCKAAKCGDGFVQAGSEACDDGNQQNGDGCDMNCMPSGGAKQVDAGWYHTCALTYSGKVHCWGLNTYGELGQGNTITIGDTELPNTVPAVDLGGTAVALSLGEYHSCALLDDGQVRCWGRSNVGQLGLGSTTSLGDNEKPSLAQPVNVGGKVTQIAAGRNHTCALLDTGKVRCWGAGASGALGYNNVNNIGDGELPFSAGDVTVGADVLQVTAGDTFTCVRTAADNVRCWGLATGGRLGYANANVIGDNEFPSVAGDVNFGAKCKAIAAGATHVCVITDSDNVRCWGTNGNGQLGYGHVNNIGDNEMPNAAGNVSIGDPIVEITAGLAHTCARTPTGSVRCWGNSTYGQLGQGNVLQIGDNEVPSVIGPVDLGVQATQISSEWYQSCARLTSGGLRCWGRSNSGQLGYGNLNSVGDNEIPASVMEVPFM
ncbi:MAG: DUF4215 domain-containing protein [Myxococcales bacterium]|nr:DUF4215 domain-containing protein [Myxococcales bacterium]